MTKSSANKSSSSARCFITYQYRSLISPKYMYSKPVLTTRDTLAILQAMARFSDKESIQLLSTGNKERGLLGVESITVTIVPSVNK